MKEKIKLKKGDKKFLWISIIGFTISVLLGFFIEIKIMMIILFSVLLVSGIFIYKNKVGQELIIAFLIAIGLTSYFLYSYTSFNIFLGKINLFPLISWTFGLVLLREVYERINVKNKFVLTSLLYWIVLLVVEYIGYYLFKIELNTNFPSLFNLGVIHGPMGMKVFYLLAGPTYLWITNYLKVE